MRTLQRLALSVILLTVASGSLLATPLLQPSAPGVSSTSSARHTSAPLATVLATLGALAFGIVIKKDAGTLAQKYSTRSANAQGDYQSGVTGAGGTWENAAKAAETSYEQGVQDAIGRKAFGKGVSGSAQKYEQNATKLGPQRYAQGVQNATGAWAQGVQPYLDTLKAIQLPPRGPRRSPQNQQRANMVALELGKKRTGQ